MDRSPPETGALEAPERRCESCGRGLAPDEGRFVRVRRDRSRLLCQDCEDMLLPPDSLMGPIEADSRVRPVSDGLPAADPRAATVELPPPTGAASRVSPVEVDSDRTPSGDSSGSAPSAPSVRTRSVRLAFYVALAAFAGAVAGLVWMALFGGAR